MAITPIQVPTRQPKKDAMDRILQGLQIANEVFKIPVGIEQLKAAQADRQLKQFQAEATPEGYVPVAASESNVIGSGPKVAPLMPGQFGPEAPNVDYGPRETLLPRMVDGEKKLVPHVAREDIKAQDARTAKLQDDYAKESEDVRIAVQNYKIGNKAYEMAKGGTNKAAQQGLLFQAARLLNPGLSRMTDTDLLSRGDSVPDVLKKSWDRVMGSQEGTLDKAEIAEVKGLMDSAMQTRLEAAYALNTKYSDRAKGSRIDPRQVGMEDLDQVHSLLPKKSDAAPVKTKSGGEPPKAKASSLQDDAKAELAKRSAARSAKR